MKPVLRQVVVFGMTFVATNVISYAFVVVAGRTLTPSQFSMLNALLGLIGLATVLASALQLEVTRRVARDASRLAFSEIVVGATMQVFPGVAIGTVLAILASKLIGAHVSELLISGGVVLVIFSACAGQGYVAGIGRIESQGSITLVGAGVRLVVGWALMAAGFGVQGALLGYLVSYSVILLAASSFRQHHSSAGALVGQRTHIDKWNWRTLTVFLFTLAPFSIDQVQVQAFSPELGGPYAAVANIAKMVYFSVYPVIAVIYPRLVGEADARRFRSIAVAGAVGVATIAVLTVAVLATIPQTVERVFYSGRYEVVVPVIGSLALAMGLFSISAYGAHVFVARSIRLAVAPPLAGCVTGLVLFAFRNDTLGTLVSNQLVAASLQACLTLLVLWRVCRNAPRIE
jgi:O-antigen/teichoic acid export membrane protein